MNDGLGALYGGDIVTIVLRLGVYVIGFFATIFLFYTNSFLLKQRKKEFGLFNILGMEKRHIARLIGIETIIVSVSTTVLGLMIGILFDKLMFLAIVKLIGAKITLGFYISWKAIILTLILFAIIFVIIYLNSLKQIHLSQPIELLRGSNVGEKEPKAKWILAVLGTISLGIGYYISLTIVDPVMALVLFFVAVMFVIVGTYLLFTAGSIAMLKLLKKNRKYYYQTKHFISVSGMMYRMKQNAVGLANICILSTMVLVMISTTSSTMIGMKEILTQLYPHDISIRGNNLHRDKEGLNEIISSGTGQTMDVSDEVFYRYINFRTYNDNGIYIYQADETKRPESELIQENFYMISLEDYEDMTGESYELAPNEVLAYTDGIAKNQYTIGDVTLTVKAQIPSYVENLSYYGYITNYIVLDSMETLQDMERRWITATNSPLENTYIRYVYSFNIKGSFDEKLKYYDELTTLLHENGLGGGSQSKQEGELTMKGIYGGLFFLGIFLGTLFTMATILIIYYKQISEGYEDKHRFEIMSKVGIDQDEIRKSIRSQVLTVFFLPLVTAGIHIAFAFPIIRKLLLVIGLSNVSLYIWCTLGCFAAFSIVYGIIYSLTARTYYKIVS